MCPQENRNFCWEMIAVIPATIAIFSGLHSLVVRLRAPAVRAVVK